MFLRLSLLVLLASFALRLPYLGHDSFWIDEMLTAYATRDGLASALQASNVHPPLHYILVAGAAAIWGETEFSLRLVSLWAGVLGIALLLQLGRTLRIPWVGFWAAVLLTVSPFHLKYAQEARHYALLMAVSLLTYILLLRAWRQPGWRIWLAYGAATAVNIYTHYGAFLVLGTQAILLAGWGVAQLRNGRYSLLRYPLTAAGLVVALYLPWLARLLVALRYSIGAEATADTGPSTPLAEWLRTSFYHFGMYERETAVLILLSATLGLLIWLGQRRWLTAVVTLAAIFLPYLFIQLFDIVRGALPRYVIYVLPFYLLLAAVLPANLLLLWRRYTGRLAFAVATLLLAVLIGWRSWPIIQHEYQYMTSDWRGVLAHLDQTTSDSGVLVGLSLDFPNRFNIVTASLPYYWDLLESEQTFLRSGEMTPDLLRQLPPASQNVRALYYAWRLPPQFADETIQVTPFQTSVFLIEQPQSDGTTYEQLIHLYEQLLPLTLSPAPVCDLYQDLAALHIVNGDYLAAYDAWERALQLCPEPSHRAVIQARPEIVVPLFYGLLDENTPEATSYAQRLAAAVLVVDPKNQAALDSLTAVNLQTQFQHGPVEIEQSLAPEAAAVRSFLMPEHGDEREVIFAHPPAAIHFPLELPTEPLLFRTQLGLDPQTRNWGGDGVTFVVTVAAADGPSRELFRQHIPNEPAAYGWHEVALPLADYAGQAITLTLAMEAGPAGDATGDWAGWVTPRLMYEEPPGG